MRNKQTGALADNSPVYERKINVYQRPTPGHNYIYLYSTNAARTCKEAVQRFEDNGRVFYMAGAGLCKVDSAAKIQARFAK